MLKGWTPQEEQIITHIMATETMHDPENTTGDRRIECNRSEAIRRMCGRTEDGIYRKPTGLILKAATLLVTPKWQDTPARQAARPSWV